MKRLIFAITFFFLLLTSAYSQPQYYESSIIMDGVTVTDYQFKNIGIYQDIVLTFRFSSDTSKVLFDSIYIFTQFNSTSDFSRITLKSLNDYSTIVNKIAPDPAMGEELLATSYIVNCPVIYNLLIQIYTQGEDIDPVWVYLQATR